MKTATDPRHLRRREAVKILFAETYTKQPSPPDLVQKILKQKNKINKLILVSEVKSIGAFKNFLIN